MRRCLAALLVLWLAAAGGAAAKPSLFAINEPWLDEHGHPVRLSQWRGKPAVVAMEYSACRFVCSVYWRRLVELQKQADQRGLDLQFVILSIDPENDSPALWREYRKARDLTRTNWHFLTASRPVTTRAAGLLGVRWWYDEGHLMHDFRIVRLDGEGAVGASVIGFGDSLEPLLTRP